MDAKAYNSIVDEWADSLFRFTVSLCKNREDANDIVQESFTKLWERKDAVNPEKVKSYLFTTAHHKVIDLYRKGSRYKDIENVTIEMSVSQKSHDLQEVLHEALSKLPEIQKSVVLLRDYEGYSYDEIADITGLNVGQVKVYIFRARQKLKNYIGRLDLVL